MILLEIQPITAQGYKGGKTALKQKAFSAEQLALPRRKLGIGNLTYSIIRYGDMLKLTVWDEQSDVLNVPWHIQDHVKQQYPGNPIAQVVLEEDWLPIKNAFSVTTVTVDEDYSGQGIAQKMYALLLQKEKLVIVAGESQTPDGRRLWANLTSNPKIDVTGYVAIDVEDHIDVASKKAVHRLQDDLFAKLGAQHLGTVERRSSKYEFFQFPVEKTTDGKKLKAILTKDAQLHKNMEPAVAKVYSKAEKFETGLIAKWIGA